MRDVFLTKAVDTGLGRGSGKRKANSWFRT